MCGILGLVRRGVHAPSLSLMPPMAGLMRHRGPDGDGYAAFDPDSGEVQVLAGPDTPRSVLESSLPYAPKQQAGALPERFRVGLGHRRLAIIDLSAAGHQPLCDPTGRYWIAFNGEIYNFRDVRREIEAQGHRFQGASDTEVALAAYALWGDACQERFNGMWTMLVWDRRERTLWISRDRFGVKPLFYVDRPDCFAVASEIKCLLPLGPLEPDRREALAYLADGPSEAHTETMFQGVRRFPPGACALLRPDDPPGSLTPRRWFHMPPPCLEHSFSASRLDSLAEEYRELLKDAVRLRLFADVKVSCALSGGLDSSSIALLASEVRREQGDSHLLATVSNVYTDPRDAAVDESRWVDFMARLLPVESLRVEPGPEDLLANNDLGLWHYENVHEDMPQAFLATFGLCRASGITVNLDGQGADENLAGYLRYVRDFLARPAARGIDYWRTFLKAPLPFREKLFAVLRLKTRPGGSPLEHLAAARLDPDYRAARRVSTAFADQPLNVTLHGNLGGSLPKLLRNVDCHSMFHGIESRQPFMDYRLILFLNALPAAYKIHGGWTKFLARKAFQGRLPDEVVWRRDKMGWPQPLKRWMAPLQAGPMRLPVLQSPYLKDLLGDALDNALLDALMPSYRLSARLYNLARHHALFHELAPAALAQGRDPRAAIASGDAP
ncbi:Asparagine synthetase [glutamine-hydrolyzing] 1 [Fundidesulfovibrio magnetotacticus]|uniref:asparagine synthase (glutamine-hydrolyzing) n=1 Tax=Fundidesulfovibrio magnetotacticus TaxID=2730080 RepID=A0A6V8LYE5_9BACT|nr:asparagine synthase (glutamine-hydrolyzing) [Fundidesulfovibrio magnetotacticus]GFK94826.1 Asparagine synthetase [glutamine-hydrolyzing] 1 [Fundidesulfovibrio magnetotacticus]